MERTAERGRHRDSVCVGLEANEVEKDGRIRERERDGARNTARLVE